MKTLFAIVGGVCTGLVIFMAGSETYKNNEAYREWYDGIDEPNEKLVKKITNK